MSDFSELLAYKKSFELAMAIFEASKLFPKEEIKNTVARNKIHQPKLQTVN